jgi:thymidylate kinase
VESPINNKRNQLLIGVVGVCASGKSTLIEGLVKQGYRARHIAQEHSYVKDMWRRITNPDLLIFLDASFAICCERKKLDWTEKDYDEEQRRLGHARDHANLYINTSTLDREDVLEIVVKFIDEFSLRE